MSNRESVPPLGEYLQQAHELMSTERWPAAHELLQESVRHYKRSADLLSALARAEHALGNPGRAIDRYHHAIRVKPDLAFLHHDLGTLLVEQGSVDYAIDCFHRALALQPRYPTALNSLAQALLHQGDLTGAAKTLAQLLAITREYWPAYSTFAQLKKRSAAFRLDDHQEVQRHLWAVAERCLLGSEPEKALQALNACEQLGLSSAALETNRSAALLRLGKVEEARAAAARALQLDPAHANAHVNLASAYLAAGDSRAAIPYLKRAAELAPSLAPAFISLGNAYIELGEYGEGRTAYQHALTLMPNAAEALGGLALTYHLEGRSDEATTLYRRALNLAPGYGEGHSRLGRLLLLQGQLSEGFREYAWRRQDPSWREILAAHPGAAYEGQPLSGKTLLLHVGTDLTEAVQLLRYVVPLKAAGARVVLDCPAAAQALFAAQPYVDEVLDWSERRIPCDYFAPLFALPLIFGTTLENVPSQVPYLQAPEPLSVAECSERERNVGLIWARAHARAERGAGFELRLLNELRDVTGVNWLSLQTGPAREQIAVVPGLGLSDLARELGDLPKAAALISRLDLLITADGLAAHLAGALGVPVWVFVTAAPDWCWMASGDKTPWYPTARVFRQSSLGDWTRVGQELCTAFREWAAQPLG